MKILRLTLLVIGLLMFSGAYADDSDIYLNDPGRSNPPYLMLMVDFTPDTGRSYCKPLTGCISLMSEGAFAKLCRLYATKPGGNPDHSESACRLLWNQVKSGGFTTQTMPSGL